MIPTRYPSLNNSGFTFHPIKRLLYQDLSIIDAPIKYLDSTLKLNHCKKLASNISKLILFLNFKKIDLNDLYNVTITEWLSLLFNYPFKHCTNMFL